MPTYEYLCASCKHQFETVQRMTDQPLTECPECKANALQKVLNPGNFQLKGSGWYVTDFRDKPKPETKAEDKTALPKSETPAVEGKTEAPAEKTGASEKASTEVKKEKAKE